LVVLMIHRGITLVAIDSDETLTAMHADAAILSLLASLLLLLILRQRLSKHEASMPRCCMLTAVLDELAHTMSSDIIYTQLASFLPLKQQ
jgi:hypothetical protein